MPSAIRFASFLGDNAFEFYSRVVAYLGETTGLPTRMVPAPWEAQDSMFEDGLLEAGFACGLPYVWKAASADPPVRLLAAPVLPGERYQDRPIYFSDVIVRSDSPHRTFQDLRGATFAYNQTTSFSGYVLPRYHLLTLGESFRFFGKAIASGSHANSMNWVEEGRVDCSAIDSVVLHMELLQRPERAQVFRVVESMGPAGMPPVIASNRLGPDVHETLTQALVHMHETGAGQAILRPGGVRRFAAVSDRNYDDIRRIVRAVAEAGSDE